MIEKNIMYVSMCVLSVSLLLQYSACVAFLQTLKNRQLFLYLGVSSISLVVGF